MEDKTKVALIAGITVQDTSKPYGTIRKIIDVPKIRNLGWAPGVSLLRGIEAVIYECFKDVCNVER